MAETKKIAETLIKQLRPNNKQATIVGLFGDLGSGKTTFTQIIAELLGVEETVTSPTFVIEKIYLLNKKNKFERLIHIDAYRLDSGQELANLGFEELLKDSKNLILIEWPERVADILPKDLIKINFKFISEFEREIGVI